MIKKLNLSRNVKFINKYLELQELLQYLRASDIFISSPQKLQQIVSGTLSYAMGCGRPVITTHFLHARELVTKSNGILVKPNSPKSISEGLVKLLSNDRLRENMGKDAYARTRFMLWKNVANSYMEVFRKYAS